MYRDLIIIISGRKGVVKKIIIISGIVLLGLTLTGCKKTETTATPTPSATVTTSNLPASNLTNVDPTAVDTVVQQNYNLAKVKAQEWKSDAVLVSLSVKLPSDLSVNASDETYVFGSATDTTNWWSFSISEKTSRYIRASIPKEDYLGADVTPINISYWKMNYAKAFQLAEVNGGSAFRAINPSATVTTTLHQTQPRGWLWWDIEYKAGTNSLIIKVNPNTGDVVDESGNPLTSGTTGTTPATTTPAQ